MSNARKGPATRAGLTPDRIVDAAAALTEGRGLHAWSLRDLAKALDVAPSVIYHHIGGKDELCRRVVGRVVASLDRPDPGLEWRDWLRALLFPARAKMAAYPGTAMWVLMHGPTFEHLVPIMNDGVAAMAKAGFGERTGLAYSAVVNCALLTIAAGDERLAQADDGPRDRAAIPRDFERLGDAGPGATELKSVASSLTDEAAVDGYYRFVVETMIRGLEPER
ncbi:TetR/AcrR family transcriptional regulator [Glycomyces sp. NPDC047369]